MSSSNNGGGLQSIPAASRKMVQSLKEIVNCPELEIYAMLKDCNMDPNEAVNRLLSQDPFHEVKSKREKKKENKEITESRFRGFGNSSSHGGRGGTDRYVGCAGSTQFSSSESGVLLGKSSYKKENGTNNYTSASSLAFEMAGNNTNRRPPADSDLITIENKVMTIDTVDGIQLSSGYQPAWSGVPGQVSMADIVKMGRPHSKGSITTNPSQYANNHLHAEAPRSNASLNNLHSSEVYLSVSEINPEPGVGTLSPNDEGPLIEQLPAACVPSVLEPPVTSELYVDASHLSSDKIQHSQFQKDDVRAVEDIAIENINANQTGSASVSIMKIEEDNSGGASLFNNDIYKNMGSYQPHTNSFELREVEDVGVSVSSVTSTLQQLSVQEDRVEPAEEDNPSVIIPNHLQVQSADCSHLSFGSFGSGISAAFSGPFSSRPLKSNIEETSADADADASLVGHSDTTNPEYYGNEPLRTASDGNLVHRTGANAGFYDSSSSSQPEVLKQENTEAPHETQYMFLSSSANYNFDNGQQLNAAFPQTSSHTQNLPPFSSQAYTNSLPSSLLAASVQPVRESELPYSPFLMTQSMPTKYGSTVSSISGSTISVPEALKTVGFSSTQPSAQILPGSNVDTGPGLPQHLAVHPYSQPSLQLGPFASMISYPYLPTSYTYLPSTFQQAFGSGNSTHHQSLAAAAGLPQYKNNNVSVDSLPQSAAIASGYGGFGSSTSIPGNFPPAAPGPTTIGYDDILSSQYKDSNHSISLQQNENSAMWVHGLGSRTMSAVPASTYYSFQGHSQQPSGFRQTQQPSQSYGALGYPNFYHSQSGISLEHQQQQQNPRDGPLGGSQGQQPSKHSQQIWQSSY